MAIQSNPELLLASLLRLARRGRTTAEAITYVEGLQNASRTGWQAGDYYTTTISQEGSSSSWIREISDAVFDNLCEVALQTLEAEVAAADAGLEGTLPGSHISHADFSRAPSILG